MMKLLYLRITVVGLLSCWAATQDLQEENIGKATCKVQQNVQEDKPTHITCLFNLDVHKHKKDFYVYRFPRDNSEKASIITVCNWDSSSNGHDCKVTDGYSLNAADISDRVDIKIQAAREMNFVCSTLPSEPSVTPEHCTLLPRKRTEDAITCDTPSPVLAGQQASVMCIFPRHFAGADITVEKYSSSKSSDAEEIFRYNSSSGCNYNKGCMVMKKTDTYLKISFPSASSQHSGFYKCISGRPDGDSVRCKLEVIEGHSDARYSDVNGWILYTILVCAIVTVITLPALLLWVYKRNPGRPFSASYKGETISTDSDSDHSGDSRQPLKSEKV